MDFLRVLKVWAGLLRTAARGARFSHIYVNLQNFMIFTKNHEIPWKSIKIKDFIKFCDLMETGPQNHQYSLGNIGVFAIY